MHLDIDEIRALAQAGQIKWTSHIMMRMEKRSIEPSDVHNCILSGHPRVNRRFA